MAYSLVIFARYPQLGKVKTRLTPELGVAQCLELHQCLLLDTIERTAALDLERYLYLADCSEQQLLRWAEKWDLADKIGLRRQQGADLGERMWNACRQVAPGSEGVIFLGVDSPSLPLSYIGEAQKKLGDFPVVIGPAEDGGYYLLALSAPREELFRDVSWGACSVLEQTIARLPEGGYALLPPWYDVDTISDLRRLAEDLREPSTPAPERTKYWLEKMRM